MAERSRYLVWSKGLTALCVLTSTSAFSAGWFPIDRPAFMVKLRAEIEKAEAVAPVADPKCGPMGIIRRCRAMISPAVEILVSDTVAAPPNATDGKFAEKYEAMKAGAAGALYEVELTYSVAKGEPVDGLLFDTLCAATIKTLTRNISFSAAESRYKAALRRATNKAPASNGRIGTETVKAKPGTLIVSVDQGASISCKVTAETAL